MRLFLWSSLFIAVSLSGCHCGNSPTSGEPEGPPGSFPGLTSLVVTPADQTLRVGGPAPVSSAYQVQGIFSDGRTEDLTQWATFGVGDSSLGSFSGNTFNTQSQRGA